MERTLLPRSVPCPPIFLPSGCWNGIRLISVKPARLKIKRPIHYNFVASWECCSHIGCDESSSGSGQQSIQRSHRYPHAKALATFTQNYSSRCGSFNCSSLARRDGNQSYASKSCDVWASSEIGVFLCSQWGEHGFVAALERKFSRPASNVSSGAADSQRQSGRHQRSRGRPLRWECRLA